MGWFSDDSDQAQAYNQFTSGEPHKSSITHELIAGAASFEAAKAYENHCAENGQPESHARAKELLAGFAGAFVDREVETRGLDFIDKEKAKYQARQQAEQALANDSS
ncbi:CipC1 protein [Clavulina sp. PMI_390]|nr:CipC1 protein [Clavulina sp. PMI_390]